MPTLNTSKPTTTITNTARVSFGELWSTITTSWSSEVRDWLTTGSLFTNTTKQSSSITNSSKPS